MLVVAGKSVVTVDLANGRLAVRRELKSTHIVTRVRPERRDSPFRSGSVASRESGARRGRRGRTWAASLASLYLCRSLMCRDTICSAHSSSLERKFGPCGSARESVADAPEDLLQFVDFCLQGVDARSLSL